MIHYTLQCAKGHSFGEWFDRISAFDERSAAGDLVCPECGDKHVAKALMAPNLSTRAPEPMAACDGGDGPACATCPMAESA